MDDLNNMKEIDIDTNPDYIDLQDLKESGVFVDIIDSHFNRSFESND